MYDPEWREMGYSIGVVRVCSAMIGVPAFRMNKWIGGIEVLLSSYDDLLAEGVVLFPVGCLAVLRTAFDGFAGATLQELEC
jgi:hypothetical protein